MQDTIWTRTYGSTYSDFGYSIAAAKRDGFIVTGKMYDDSAGSTQLCLLRCENNGDTLWLRTYGGNGLDCGNSVQFTMDSGYVATGETNSFGAGYNDVYLVKTDGYGDTLWTATFGGPEYDRGNSIIQIDDGGYAIVGATESFGYGQMDVYLIRTDHEGNLLWQRTFGGDDIDYGECIQHSNDGGFIISGSTRSFSGMWNDVYLIKTDIDGNMQWQRTYGLYEREVGFSVKQTFDGGYIIAGSMMTYGNLKDIYVIKTDANGDTVWTRILGGPDEDIAYSVIQSPDGSYFITGFTYSYGFGASDIFLLHVGQYGDMLGMRTYGGDRTDIGYSIVESDPGEFIIAGATWSFGSGPYHADLYIVKVRPFFTDIDNNELLQQPFSINVFNNYPNPFNAKTTIEFALAAPGDVELTIYDITGAKVKELVSAHMVAGKHSVEWDASGCGSGTYFAKITTGIGSKTLKMVMIK
ncbi:MAG: T9SS type A sorting domain-containing protein [Candidatus Zixiibacteriota bacterium]|nr:MAG: T9SS type A sorting domain-containing protein [candidate division Zixibacteria bacterium]